MIRIYPVLMVGGSGTRLWPVSRQDMPKQFQNLLGDKSLFQETLLRVTGQTGNVAFAPPIIIGAARFQELIEAQMAQLGIKPSQIVLEPCARSTTPVAVIASKLIEDIDPNGLALLLPSDHHIADADTFRLAIDQAASTAVQDWITTFGIAPTHADTGFGYISAGKPISAGTHQVANFFEKPNLETAQTYVQDPAFSWNAGIFLFKPSHMVQELNAYAPDILSASLSALDKATSKGHVHLLDEAEFSACEDLSIDYSVMEKTDRAAVLGPLACGWSDVGNWQAIADLKGSAPHKDILAIDAATSFFQTDGSVSIAAVGLENMVVVAHQGTVMIVPKDQAQRVQELVTHFKSTGQIDKVK